MNWNDFVSELQRNKILYYTRNFLRQLVPTWFYRKELENRLRTAPHRDMDMLIDRVNYYNKLDKPTPVGYSAVQLNEARNLKGPRAYFFDTYEVSKYFDQTLKANFLFKDVIHVPDVPTLQKSRPIAEPNANAVILKLDKKRHFPFIKDNKRFSEKKNMLIGRGVMEQPHRVRFMELYFNHPLCDLGQVNKLRGNPDWIKPRMTIGGHLDYKFILSLEGNDVATNLKWVMSSNSVAVMPKPKYETWFMEGRLIPDHHYILIQDDYMDLEEKLRYFINNPDQAATIVRNANQYTRQFLDQKREHLLSLLVLQKYFCQTSQWEGLVG